VQGWSERASGEQAYNADARDVMADPLETPIIAAVAGAVVVYAFSRVMLGLPSKTATVIAFAVVATVVLIAGAIVGFKRTASKVAMAGAFSVATVALIGVGTFAGLNGEREIEEHHSTAYIAAEDECGTEETEADENASNTVANTSNLAAEVTYDGSELSAELPGLGGGFDSITLPRSNPSNVLFRNNSGHHARLVIELHESESVEVSEGGEGEEVEDGEHGPTERLCTALVDDGGVQLLTIVFDRPSIAVEGGYELTVPGSDASVEVVVP